MCRCLLSVPYNQKRRGSDPSRNSKITSACYIKCPDSILLFRIQLRNGKIVGVHVLNATHVHRLPTRCLEYWSLHVLYSDYVLGVLSFVVLLVLYHFITLYPVFQQLYVSIASLVLYVALQYTVNSAAIHRQ